MKNITVSIDDKTHETIHSFAAESGIPMSDLINQFLMEYCRIGDPVARQVFMHWLHQDAESAMEPGATNRSSRLHIYR